MITTATEGTRCVIHAGTRLRAAREHLYSVPEFYRANGQLDQAIDAVSDAIQKLERFAEVHGL